MNSIVIKTIEKNENHIEIPFSINPKLKSFFREKKLKLSYTINGNPINMEKVPDSILVIPLICNILPIAWLTDSEISIPVIDKDFFESIDNIKQGYINMYPDCNFKGKITATKIESNKNLKSNKCAVFFSGGVDAYCTLVRHILEKPDLVTIWGADIPYDDKNGWTILQKAIHKEADALRLPFIVIHSSFRKMINESNLTIAFQHVLHDGWWHGAQHGIGLIGHAAPSNYLRGVSTQYIAASYWPGAKLTCASWPTIDNYIHFCGCSTVHDAFIPRQDKIQVIVKSHYENNIPINLHVCWKTTTGENCCLCEKCCRTIMGFLVEGENPSDYGFNVDENILNRCIHLCKNEFIYDFISIPFWEQIKQKAIENKKYIEEKGFSKYVDWIKSFDFIEKKVPLLIQVKKISRDKLKYMKWYCIKR